MSIHERSGVSLKVITRGFLQVYIGMRGDKEIKLPTNFIGLWKALLD